MEYYARNELYHHGILGQKWGVRRYQNPDGTYTAAGKKRLKVFREVSSIAKGNADRLSNEASKFREMNNGMHERYDGDDGWRNYAKDAYGTTDPKDFGLSEKQFKEWMSSELRTNMQYSDADDRRKMASYESAAKRWMDLSKAYENVSLDKITNKDIKQAKFFIATQKYLGSSVSDLVNQINEMD